MEEDSCWKMETMEDGADGSLERWKINSSVVARRWGDTLTTRRCGGRCSLWTTALSLWPRRFGVFPFTYFVIVGSCDGIVCLYDYGDNSIILWNPSIRRTVILPDCPRRCYSEVEVAFGYDPIADDYKVVSLPIVNVNRDGGSYVYAMKTDACFLIDSPMPDFRKVKTKACFVSGALHWLAQRYKKSNWYILTFDLSTHVFSSVVSPHITRTVVPISLRGCLAIIINESSIWVRRDDSWSVEIKLEKNNDVGDLKGVLQLGTSCDLIFDLYSIGYEMYNPNTGACLSLVDFDDAYFLLDVVPCVESLQLLDIGTSC
ncbi:hypothetical protein LXL04_006258 [Taraxacum kok-saghyz]